MTDIEHAKKYAEESISVAISMYNPKAEIIAETACLYGLTYKNEQIADLEKENAELRKNGVCVLCSKLAKLEREKKELEEENAELKNKLEHRNCLDCSNHSSKLRMRTLELEKECTKAKKIIREFVEWANWQGSNCPNFKSIQDKAEQFLNEVEK